MKPGVLFFYDFKGIRQIFSSLHSRNYRLYFTGQGISLIGTWMQNVAMSWLVYRLTGSVFLLGLVGFTNQIPAFILTPFTGVLTDRHNRHRIMLMTQVFYLLQALTIALLVLFNLIEVWHIIALSIVHGIISAFDAPARQSLVVDLIEKPEDLGNAIALNSAIFNAARLVGPAIAGVTIALVGEGICFLLNAVSYFSIITALLKIRIPSRQKAPQAKKFRHSFSEGLRYTFTFLPIRTLILLLAVLSLFGMQFIVLLPAYASEILHGSSDTLGFLMSAMGAGALVGALTMAARRSVLGLGKILAVNTCLQGISVILLAVLTKMHLSMLILFIGGLCMILSLASINTMLQTITDEDKRGRVMSFYAMALMGTTPIGNLLTGSVASWIGIPYTLIIGGTVTLLAGLLFEVYRKPLQKFIHPIYVNKGIVTGIQEEIS